MIVKQVAHRRDGNVSNNKHTPTRPPIQPTDTLYTHNPRTPPTILITAAVILGLTLSTGYAYIDWTTPRQPIPAGTIVMWSGPTDEIPHGWALCNGENDTPDLRGRFIVGAGDEYQIGDTGGQSEVIHDHELLSHPARHLQAGSDYTNLSSPNASDNRPPYYSLAFIIKTR